MKKRVETFDYDVISMWFNRSVFFPGNEQITYWHSSQADQLGSNNLAGVKSPAVDALLARITSATTEAELRPAPALSTRIALGTLRYPALEFKQLPCGLLG